MMRTACLLRFDLNFICALLLASLLAVPADAQQMEAKKGLPAPRSIAEVLRSGQAIPAWAARRGVVKQVPDAELDANVSDELGPRRLRMGVDSFSSGFEPPCFIGYIGGGGSGQPQNCNWHASNGCDENCTQPTIIASNPFNGDQHLHFEFDPGQLGGASARNWAFTDSIANPPLNGVMSLTLQLNINQLGGLNEYHIRPQASGQGAAALMIFLPTGEILAFEDLDPDDGVIDGFFTGFDWVPGEYKQVGICIDNPAGRVRYFYDGDLIWSSGAGEGGQGTGVFGATTIQNLVILYDDNQNDSTSMDVDDVLIEPDNCLQPTGACCNIDGVGGCLRETAEACELSGTGLYAGDNSNCSEGLCAGLEVCGGAGTGSCFVPGGPEVPGCAEFDCCLEVCELQPTCCTEVWDSACTNIALDECSVPCDSDETQCQAAGSFDAFNSTIGEFEVADNFSPAVSGTLNTPCWSGVYLGNPFIEDSFVIRYFTCVDGVPTTPIAEFSESGGTLFVTGKEDTGVDLAGSFDIFEYTAIHPGVAVTAGEVYFVEISNGPPGGDAWFWVAADDNESNGDGVFYQKPFGADYARHFRGCRADLSFCI
ncbi:MAG: hypothetical protein IID41_12865, partial [Planctomycetes bacterium]|nr:hypothetical protein [Planctomycetota bacterium]